MYIFTNPLFCVSLINLIKVSESANNIINSNLKFEKFKFWISFGKWFVGSVALVVITMIIDNGYKERSAGIQEMQAFDRYVDIILKADNIEERWKLSEFFSEVTPTERLRMRWVSYKKLISADYKTFKKLKETEIELREKIQLDKSPKTINELLRIRKQLEPYERRLSDQVPPQTRPEALSLNSIGKDLNANSPNLTGKDLEGDLKFFKENIQKNAATDSRYKLDEYFQKARDIHDTAVREILKELGSSFQDIQTNIGWNFKDAIYNNQFGIVSKFDDTKKIWPIFQAKFIGNVATFTMNDSGNIETYSCPITNIPWDNVKKFIRSYFLKRLDQLR